MRGARFGEFMGFMWVGLGLLIVGLAMAERLL